MGRPKERTPAGARWVIRGYARGYLLGTTYHYTDKSKDAEVAAWRARIAHGDGTRIEIDDCRPADERGDAD